MITVTFNGRRIPFHDAASYDYIQGLGGDAGIHDSLALFDDYGERIATFYRWDAVDAGETP